MPENSPSNLINEIADFIDIYTDAPDVFKELAGYFIISTLFGPRVQLSYVGEPFKPNISLALVAGSRCGRKSTIMSYINNFIHHIDKDILIFNKVTPERLMVMLSGKDRALFESREFGGYYKSINTRSYLNDLLYILSTLYGAEPLKYDTQKGSFHIPKGFFLNSIVGIPTPISRYIKDTGDFHEGYFNRYLFMQIEEDQYNEPRNPFEIKSYYSENNKFEPLIDEIKKRYDYYNGLRLIHIHILPDIEKKLVVYEKRTRKQLFEIIEKSNTQIRDPEAYNKYYGELVKYITKLAIIHRIGRLPLPKNSSDPGYAIEMEDLEEAFKLFRSLNKSVISIINEVSDVQIEEEHKIGVGELNIILGHIKSTGKDGISRTNLHNACRGWLENGNILTRHLTTLMEREEIIQIKVEGKTRPSTYYKLKKYAK